MATAKRKSDVLPEPLHPWSRRSKNADVKIEVEHEGKRPPETNVYHAHGAILSAGYRCSEYFEKQYFDDKKSEYHFVLPPKVAAHFGYMLDWLHGVEQDTLFNKLDPANTFALYWLARYFKVQSLSHSLEEFISDHLPDATFEDLLEYEATFRGIEQLEVFQPLNAGGSPPIMDILASRLGGAVPGTRVRPELLGLPIPFLIKVCQKSAEKDNIPSPSRSLFVAHCCEANHATISPSSFYALTDHLIFDPIEYRAAKILLETRHNIVGDPVDIDLVDLDFDLDVRLRRSLASRWVQGDESEAWVDSEYREVAGIVTRSFLCGLNQNIMEEARALRNP